MNIRDDLFAITARSFAADHDMDEAQQFFYENAGFSYAPGESQEEGHRRCARALANAEAMIDTFGYSFRWEDEPEPNYDLKDDAGHVLPQWICVMENNDGEVIASLGGIAFADDHDPLSDPYHRVVQAELAMEGMS